MGCIVHGVTKSQTRLSDFHCQFHLLIEISWKTLDLFHSFLVALWYTAIILGSSRTIFLRSPFSSVQLLSCVRFFATPWIAARQAFLTITNSRSSPRFTSIESVVPSSHLILFRPLLLLPQSLPASESFPVSQLFAWGGQSTGVSALASFLPKKSQGRSPSEWTGWISLWSKGLSRVFSNTTAQKHQFLTLSYLNSQFLNLISSSFLICFLVLMECIL